MRLLKTRISLSDIEPHMQSIAPRLQSLIPSGSEEGGLLKLTPKQLNEILQTGMKWMVEHGYGTTEDLKKVESGGYFKNADPNSISDQAKKIAISKIGTIEGKKQSVEISSVEQIIDPKLAKEQHIEEGNIVITIDTGERTNTQRALANYVLASRQLITHQIRLGFEDIFGAAKGHINIVYDGLELEDIVKLKPIIKIK